MRKLIIKAVIFAIMIANSVSALSQPITQQENFHIVLAKMQDSMWKGKFWVKGFGPLTNCTGPIQVKFFPLTVEEFSNGIPTVSYRHHADFSENLNPICQYVSSLSPVNVGQCGDIFPMKPDKYENKNVPFRTIIPQEDGSTAVVSSPACNKKNHEVSRRELKLAKALLSEDEKKLEIEIQIEVLGQVVHLTYLLDKQP